MGFILPGLFVSLALGIWAGISWPLSCAALLILAGGGVVLGLVWARRPVAFLLWLFVGGGLAGAASVTTVLRPSGQQCHVSRFTGRQVVRLQGEIRRGPAATSQGATIQAVRPWTSQ